MDIVVHYTDMPRTQMHGLQHIIMCLFWHIIWSNHLWRSLFPNKAMNYLIIFSWQSRKSDLFLNVCFLQTYLKLFFLLQLFSFHVLFNFSIFLWPINQSFLHNTVETLAINSQASLVSYNIPLVVAKYSFFSVTPCLRF